MYLAIGKIASALKDLTKVIELKPDFASVSISTYIRWNTSKGNLIIS